jgi:DNA-binding protein
MGKAPKNKPQRNYVMEVAYLVPETLAALKELATSTRIPRAVLVREAIDDLLGKYRKRKP